MLVGGAILVLGVPLAAITTIALLPVWSWLEARFGIEAVGHSGPADWCYQIMYLVWVSLIGFGAFRGARRRRGPT